MGALPVLHILLFFFSFYISKMLATVHFFVVVFIQFFMSRAKIIN